MNGRIIPENFTAFRKAQAAEGTQKRCFPNAIAALNLTSLTGAYFQIEILKQEAVAPDAGDRLGF